MKLYNTKDGLRYHENWPERIIQTGPRSTRVNTKFKETLSESLPVANEEEVKNWLIRWITGCPVGQEKMTNDNYFNFKPDTFYELPEGTTVVRNTNGKVSLDSVTIHLPKTMEENEKPEKILPPKKPDNFEWKDEMPLFDKRIDIAKSKEPEPENSATSEGIGTPKEEMELAIIIRELIKQNQFKSDASAFMIMRLIKELSSLRKENAELKAWRQDAEKHLIEYGKLVSYTDQLKADKQELVTGLNKNLADYIQIRDGWKKRSNQWHTYDLMVREYQIFNPEAPQPIKHETRHREFALLRKTS